jgi:hypothetical protein
MPRAIGGPTGPNPSAQFTRPANTTAYSAGDLVANDSTAANVVPMSFTTTDLADTSMLGTSVRVRINDTGPGTAAATFELWLFHVDPTGQVANGDNGAFSLTSHSGLIGRFVGTFILTGAGSMAVLTPAEGQTFRVLNPISGTTTVMGLVKTLTAFTPSANSTVYQFAIEGVQARA